MVIKECKTCSIEKATWRSIKTLYGLTQEEYEFMWLTQGGSCAICGKEDSSGKKLAVDHNHKTGAIRGLVCSKCNFFVAHLENNLHLYDTTIKYLERGN